MSYNLYDTSIGSTVTANFVREGPTFTGVKIGAHELDLGNFCSIVAYIFMRASMLYVPDELQDLLLKLETSYPADPKTFKLMGPSNYHQVSLDDTCKFYTIQGREVNCSVTMHGAVFFGGYQFRFQAFCGFAEYILLGSEEGHTLNSSEVNYFLSCLHAIFQPARLRS